MIVNVAVCQVVQYAVSVELLCGIPSPPVSAPRLPDLEHCERRTPNCAKYGKPYLDGRFTPFTLEGK